MNTTIVTSINELAKRVEKVASVYRRISLLKSFLKEYNDGVSIDVEYNKDTSTLVIYLVVASLRTAIINSLTTNVKNIGYIKDFLLGAIANQTRVTITTLNVNTDDVETFIKVIKK